MSEKIRNVVEASKLIGYPVVSPRNEKIGEVKDIMINVSPHPQGVAYFVVAVGGFLGIGEKLLAIPGSKFTVDFNNKACMLDATKQMLENSPGFDKEELPDYSDPHWEAAVHKHYERQSF